MKKEKLRKIESDNLTDQSIKDNTISDPYVSYDFEAKTGIKASEFRKMIELNDKEYFNKHKAMIKEEIKEKWNTLSEYLNEDGMLDDNHLGNSTNWSVFVLSNCTRHIIDGKMFWKLRED